MERDCTEWERMGRSELEKFGCKTVGLLEKEEYLDVLCWLMSSPAQDPTRKAIMAMDTLDIRSPRPPCWRLSKVCLLSAASQEPALPDAQPGRCRAELHSLRVSTVGLLEKHEFCELLWQVRADAQPDRTRGAG
eukprot:2256417-Rhodomonas_salina.3